MSLMIQGFCPHCGVEMKELSTDIVGGIEEGEPVMSIIIGNGEKLRSYIPFECERCGLLEWHNKDKISYFKGQTTKDQNV